MKRKRECSDFSGEKTEVKGAFVEGKDGAMEVDMEGKGNVKSFMNEI